MNGFCDFVDIEIDITNMELLKYFFFDWIR